jgi:hypothetical protein
LPTDSQQPQTITDTFDNALPADAVTVRGNGIRRVIINEPAKTTTFKVFEPLRTSGFNLKQIGETYEFTKQGGLCYEPGEVAGYVLLIDVALADFNHQEKGL